VWPIWIKELFNGYDGNDCMVNLEALGMAADGKEEMTFKKVLMTNPRPCQLVRCLLRHLFGLFIQIGH